ncbi:MAG: TatD family hydrolase [Rhizomicrobium sp.]
MPAAGQGRCDARRQPLPSRFPEFASELDAVVARAKDAGIGVCVTIGTKLANFPNVRAVAERFDDVWCSVGVHPHEAQVELLDGPQVLIEAARHPKVVGIGETGLDYYYEHSPRPQQIANFAITSLPPARPACRSSSIPAMPTTTRLRCCARRWRRRPFTGLIHCFTGTRRLAEASLDLGPSYLGFRHCHLQEIRRVARRAEGRALDRLLVETDSP